MEELTGGQYPVTLDGPACVEIAAYQQGERLIIPLVNYASDMLSVISEEGGAMAEQGLPVHDLLVHLHIGEKEVKKVYLVSSGEALAWEPDGARKDAIQIQLPVLQEHDRIIVE